MMRTINIQEGQTLVDIAMQYCGDASLVFDVATLNGLSITDELTPGQMIIVPDATIDKRKVIESFLGLVPASSFNDEEIELTWLSAGPLVITKDGKLKSSSPFNRLVTAGEGQTLVDIAMQYCGDASLVFDVAMLNGLSITDELTPGQMIMVPDATIDKRKVIESFLGLVPASKDDEDVLNLVLDGIDYWAIEEDFIVQ